MKKLIPTFVRAVVLAFTVILFICFAIWISGCDSINEVATTPPGVTCDRLRLSGQNPMAAYFACIVVVYQEEIERLETELYAVQESLGICYGALNNLGAQLATCKTRPSPTPVDCPLCEAETCPTCPSCDHDHKDKSCKNKDR